MPWWTNLHSQATKNRNKELRTQKNTYICELYFIFKKEAQAEVRRVIKQQPQKKKRIIGRIFCETYGKETLVKYGV